MPSLSDTLRVAVSGYATGAVAASTLRLLRQLLAPRSAWRFRRHEESGSLFDPGRRPAAPAAPLLLRFAVLAVVSGHCRGWSSWSLGRKVFFLLAALAAVWRILVDVPLRALICGASAPTSLGFAVRDVELHTREGAPLYHKKDLKHARATLTRMGNPMALTLFEWMGLAGPPKSAVQRTTESFTSSDGATVPLILFQPAAQGSVDGAKPAPCIVYYHGGGWVMPNVHDNLCWLLAYRTGYLVVSVDYRLAPEHPFPTAHEDGFEGYKWVLENHERLGVRRDMVFVGGDSAGGNMAASTCIMCRSRRVQSPRGQILIYPATTHRMSAPSVSRYGDATHMLSRRTMLWFSHCYLPDRGQIDDHVASPLVTPSLKNLPPAIVLVADRDVLKDEGVAYAARLARSGCSVSVRGYPRTPHGFASMRLLFPGQHDQMLHDIAQFVAFWSSVDSQEERTWLGPGAPGAGHDSLSSAVAVGAGAGRGRVDD